MFVSEFGIARASDKNILCTCFYRARVQILGVVAKIQVRSLWTEVRQGCIRLLSLALGARAAALGARA